jgi:formylglycine-generating enzyme required for sulfatase activity
MHRIILVVILTASCVRANTTNDPNVPPIPRPVPGTLWIVPEIAMKCVYVEPGTFRMGSAESGPNDEKPVHEVSLSRGFWMGACEVTQAQWRAVMETDPSKYKGDERPVEMVSWYEAVEFCRKLTDREHDAGRLPENHVYRLPTEAEWEYAARGGRHSRGFTYPGSDDPSEVAWYWPGSSDETHVVGTRRPNELGLYDMAGNVWEWCLDWYAPDYYARSPKSDPVNHDYGDKKYRVCRGGSWGLYPTHCRSANRGGGTPTGRFYSYGFRVVLAHANRTSVSRRIRLYVPSA